MDRFIKTKNALSGVCLRHNFLHFLEIYRLLLIWCAIFIEYSFSLPAMFSIHIDAVGDILLVNKYLVTRSTYFSDIFSLHPSVKRSKRNTKSTSGFVNCYPNTMKFAVFFIFRQIFFPDRQCICIH